MKRIGPTPEAAGSAPRSASTMDGERNAEEATGGTPIRPIVAAGGGAIRRDAIDLSISVGSSASYVALLETSWVIRIARCRPSLSAVGRR
eukprot:CAMPEP_0113548046 /NCGR_PEP_ID=MMETSP0015_2-20120614/12684_1 /TAXON_ID=2838 /ORGANISM="Odontella" /LENGTH=89 /DNA_ID=CAMNT_0000448649 /DNA_START=884 /DNA_END=1149 /DNA_ORIENTATION=- /assembly_acc=CAM_ASM_000160